MNNEEYEKQISYKIHYLKELRKRTCQLAGEIIGKNFLWKISSFVHLRIGVRI